MRVESRWCGGAPSSSTVCCGTVLSGLASAPLAVDRGPCLWGLLLGPQICPLGPSAKPLSSNTGGFLRVTLNLEIRCPESSNFALLRVRFCRFTNTHSGAWIGIVSALLINLGWFYVLPRTRCGPSAVSPACAAFSLGLLRTFGEPPEVHAELPR